MTKTKVLAAVITLLIVLVIWTIWGNSALELNRYTIESKKLPKSFDDFKIVQVSDLHNAEMGEDNEKLLALISEAKPDIIAITGDMIDSRRTDVEIALDFAKEAVKIAPCYYVCGNHELRVEEYDDLKEGLHELGVVILENEKKSIVRDNHEITIIGLNDPSFEAFATFMGEDELIEAYLKTLVEDDNNYKVLLSHRPELFETYAEAGVDLALSGHAHGGQIRLPIIGGIIAPHQGLLPEYDGGLYIKEETSMVVSRGIGNSIFPFRFNNRPEVVLIELQAR
ncbi:MAG: metallophosphoesterase [Firmicutes bacterium]|nr:metallophosphoesterase [Bacillota bacterium]